MRSGDGHRLAPTLSLVRAEPELYHGFVEIGSVLSVYHIADDREPSVRQAGYSRAVVVHSAIRALGQRALFGPATASVTACFQNYPRVLPVGVVIAFGEYTDELSALCQRDVGKRLIDRIIAAYRKFLHGFLLFRYRASIIPEKRHIVYNNVPHT